MLFHVWNCHRPRDSNVVFSNLWLIQGLEQCKCECSCQYGIQTGKWTTKYYFFVFLWIIQGFYKYGGVGYKASSSPSGSSLGGCRRVALKALEVNEPCTYGNCTFGGIWNGGGGDGQRNLYIASFFFDKAGQVIIILKIGCLRNPGTYNFIFIRSWHANYITGIL